ncbi:polysaccharide deacetylase family protein [Rathayibacter sp. Leaf296]|uniref:polysaccharide deacetylase family protein n=1 Tax=Rathayibacter sp. Leaf296 TaxID=1736327 RepID=UPI0007027AC1|nr:polysaccharide deacetylase family protein [Rathayibacter sp. Leaf296]KQQ08902.1 allantoinase [Rathayibacter sp. Leaf296]
MIGNPALRPARDLVGYGASSPQVTWPGGANVAVNIVVNYEEGSEYSWALGDAENDVLGDSGYRFPAGIRDLAQESMYEYGSRVGVWRLLRLFRDRDVPVTFFGCAVAFEQNPEVARVARAEGHDLVSHGWRWEEHWRLSRDEEREHIRLAVESFERTWGERPRGWYCRYGPSVHTRELVVEEGGFAFDCDAYNDDLPYFTEVGGTQHLVIPYSQTYNDSQGSKNPAEFFDYITRAFDELWEEGAAGAPKMMSIGLHPRLAGQAARTNALRRFLDHAQQRGGVWFARRGDIADWWTEHHESFPRLNDFGAP